MSRVIFDQVTKRYAGGVEAVKNLTMEIMDNEFLVLVGPSGCGKSTALRMVAGLEEITEGRIIIGDRVVNDVPPKDRDIAMVFQSYALYPHMSVYDNLAFGLKLRKVPKEEIEPARAARPPRCSSIDQSLDRKPKALSGGQRQRVALGRAIVREPQVFLMDEPLSNLDAKLRVQTRAELIKLHERLQTTTIYVTHDQVEAMTMGDRIAVMATASCSSSTRRRISTTTRPTCSWPASSARPSMNFFDATIEQHDGKLYAKAAGFTLRVPDAKVNAVQAYLGQAITLGIRPEHLLEIHQADASIPEDSLIHATVDVVELLGNEIFVYLTTSAGQVITARMDPDLHLQRGQQIQVTAPPDRLHFFDPQSEAAIA